MRRRCGWGRPRRRGGRREGGERPEAEAAGEGDADQIIEAEGLKQVTDSGAIEKVLGASSSV